MCLTRNTDDCSAATALTGHFSHWYKRLLSITSSSYCYDTSEYPWLVYGYLTPPGLSSDDRSGPCFVSAWITPAAVTTHTHLQLSSCGVGSHKLRHFCFILRSSLLLVRRELRFPPPSADWSYQFVNFLEGISIVSRPDWPAERQNVNLGWSQKASCSWWLSFVNPLRHRLTVPYC
jgi:hypothetical protein